jgi:hypothetical protein
MTATDAGRRICHWRRRQAHPLRARQNDFGRVVRRSCLSGRNPTGSGRSHHQASCAPAETFLSDYQEMAFDNWDERTAPDDGEELLLPRAKSWRQVPRATRLRLARPAAAERTEGVAGSA